MREFANRGALKPIDIRQVKAAKTLSPGWIALGTVKGKYYALQIKGTNKSTVWYGVQAFKNAGVKSPKTWPQFLSVARTVRASGLPAYSIGGADGWTLTDFFENVYIRTAGPAKYDQLATHKIKWTDRSVKTALEDDGASPRRHGQHRRRTSGSAADRLQRPSRRRSGLLQGGDGDRG